MLEGLMLALAGGLLIIPGFISDVVGLVMLLPVTRRLLANKMRQRAEDQAMRQRAFADDLQPRGGPAPREPLGREPNVIEGEFEHRDNKDISIDTAPAGAVLVYGCYLPCLDENFFRQPCNRLVRPYVSVTERFPVFKPDRLARFARRTATGAGRIR